jgi:hypothetical protein
MDMESLQRIIKKLSNEIVDMKRNIGEGTSNTKKFFKFPPKKSTLPQLRPLHLQRELTWKTSSICLNPWPLLVKPPHMGNMKKREKRKKKKKINMKIQRNLRTRSQFILGCFSQIRWRR